MQYAFALLIFVSFACADEELNSREWKPAFKSNGEEGKRRELTYDLMGKGKVRYQELFVFRPVTTIGNDVGLFMAVPLKPAPDGSPSFNRSYTLVGDTGQAIMIRMSRDNDKTSEVLTIPFINDAFDRKIATFIHTSIYSYSEKLEIKRSAHSGFYEIDHLAISIKP